MDKNIHPPILSRTGEIIEASPETFPLLALETATSVCSCAVLKDAQTVVEKSVPTDRKHGELLPELVQSACSESEVKLMAVSCIAVSIGPGSFTGLRVGLSFAKGLAASIGAYIIPVGTLTGLAYRIAEQVESSLNFIASPMTVARRGEAFGRLFNVSRESISPIGEVFILKKLELPAASPAPVWFGGEGADMLEGEASTAGDRAGMRDYKNAAVCKYIPGLKAGAAALGRAALAELVSGARRYRGSEPLTPDYIAEFTLK